MSSLFLECPRGSKLKEPKCGNENGKPAGPLSSPENCSYCHQAGHKLTECAYWITREEEEASKEKFSYFLQRAREIVHNAVRVQNESAETEVVPPPECEMCSEEHETLDCPIVAPFRAPSLEVNEQGEVYYLKDGKICESISSTPFAPEVKETECPICFASTEVCPICYKEHGIICPYESSVPKGATVSPFYPITCEFCGEDLKNTLWCPHCGKEVKAYVIGSVYPCVVCGKSMAHDCCPYGKRIADKFHASLHP